MYIKQKEKHQVEREIKLYCCEIHWVGETVIWIYLTNEIHSLNMQEKEKTNKR